MRMRLAQNHVVTGFAIKPSASTTIVSDVYQK